MQSYRLWIDGQWVDSQGEARMTNESSATEQTRAGVIDGNRASVDRAALVAELEFETVWIKGHLLLSSETLHGGCQHSGFDRDLSAEAMGDYQVAKHVMVSLA